MARHQNDRQGSDPPCIHCLHSPQKRTLFLAFGLSSGLACAQTYKCVHQGKTSYQATPCETGKDVQASTLRLDTGNPQVSGGVSCDSPKDQMRINFDNMSLRVVLQLFADFTGQKLVADPDITGSAAFHYPKRPWCEILNHVARRHQLAVRSEGDTLSAGCCDRPKPVRNDDLTTSRVLAQTVSGAQQACSRQSGRQHDTKNGDDAAARCRPAHPVVTRQPPSTKGPDHHARSVFRTASRHADRTQPHLHGTADACPCR